MSSMPMRSPRRQRRRRQKEQQQQAEEKSQGSILWTMMLLGLVFCLADVAYILHYVDTQQQFQQDQQQFGGGGAAAVAAGESAAAQQAAAVPNTVKSKVAATVKKAAKVTEAAWQNAIAHSPFKPGIDPESGLTIEEYKVMNRQLHQHEVKIFSAPQTNNVKKPHNQNAAQKNDIHQMQAGAHDETTPTTPLTDDEWKTIQVEKEHILKMLQNAKINTKDLDPATLRDLPKWKEVTDLYGDEPRIYGLDQCDTFRNHSNLWDHFVSTAGTFNSGTNLMAELLIANCHMQDRMDKLGAWNRGVRWQVPWGKHTPPGDEEFRVSHKTLKDGDVDATNILPAVTIRDPYVWMNSMCRIEYTAHWHHDPNRHCPNLMPDSQDLIEYGKWISEGKSVPVHVKYNGFWKHHDSLVGMWNDWYREYWEDKSFSKLIVRYEDLLFWPQEVTTAVCHCAGGSLKKDGNFQFVLNSAKKGESAHGPMESRTGFIKAIIKYGKAKHRTEKYQQPDMDYAKAHLDPEMMEFFSYRHPDELSK